MHPYNRDRCRSHSRNSPRLALLALDVAAVAKLAHDTFTLLVGQRSERLDERRVRILRAGQDAIEIELRTLQQLRKGGLGCQLHARISQPGSRFSVWTEI